MRRFQFSPYLFCAFLVAAAQGQSAEPAADLVFVGVITKLAPAAIAGSEKNWVVTADIESIESGSFTERVFAFRVHSPATAGLIVGKRYHFHTTRIGDGYTVNEFQIKPQD